MHSRRNKRPPRGKDTTTHVGIFANQLLEDSNPPPSPPPPPPFLAPLNEALIPEEIVSDIDFALKFAY